MEARAVGAPEHLAVDAAGQAFAEGVEDRALAFRVVAVVAVRVVDQHVHVAPEHLIGAPAEHPGAGPVDEGASAGVVDPEDAVTGRFEHQHEALAPCVTAFGGWRRQDKGGIRVRHIAGERNARARITSHHNAFEVLAAVLVQIAGPVERTSLCYAAVQVPSTAFQTAGATRP